MQRLWSLFQWRQTPSTAELAQKHNASRKTISRYFTRSPKSGAARALVLNLKNSTQTSFKERLAAWHIQHEIYLNERSTHPVTGRSHYTHKRLRSAYNSLKRNLDKLFTYERHPELAFPKQRICLREGLSNRSANCGVVKNAKGNYTAVYKGLFLLAAGQRAVNLSLTPKIFGCGEGVDLPLATSKKAADSGRVLAHPAHSSQPDIASPRKMA